MKFSSWTYLNAQRFHQHSNVEIAQDEIQTPDKSFNTKHWACWALSEAYPYLTSIHRLLHPNHGSNETDQNIETINYLPLSLAGNSTPRPKECGLQPEAHSYTRLKARLNEPRISKIHASIPHRSAAPFATTETTTMAPLGARLIPSPNPSAG